jgi:hypothetical protein
MATKPWKPKTFLPKGPVVAAQCASCPFRPGQTIVTQDGMAEIKQTAELGMDFFCHKTVYTGAPVNSPKRPESEFKACLGAAKHRDRANLRKRKAHLKRMQEQGN